MDLFIDSANKYIDIAFIPAIILLVISILSILLRFLTNFKIFKYLFFLMIILFFVSLGHIFMHIIIHNPNSTGSEPIMQNIFIS